MDDNENKNTSDSYYSYSYKNQDNMNNSQEQGDNSWSAQAQYRTYEEPINEKKHKKEKKPRQPKKSNGIGAKLAKCVALALVFGLVGGTAFAGSNYFFGNIVRDDKHIQQTTKGTVTLNKTTEKSSSGTKNTTSKDAASTVTDVSGIAANVMPSIVAITNMSEKQAQNWFGQLQNYQSKSAGSGIIVSQDSQNLYIATNNHVVADSKSITVQFCDMSTVTAEVKGTDAGDDLAVVAVKLSDIKSDTVGKIKVATVGNSDDIKAGQVAVAIGNALGYGQSVTTGVVSAVNRDVSVSDETTGATTTSKLIQTDAAINPGNSGGALLNLDGEVIGINSIKYSDTSVEGMGYAIPINKASPIIEKLINREVVKSSDTAYLGISGVDVSSSVASTYNMPEGIYIYKVVDGSAAADAGLAKGDIITAFDGTKVNSTAELEEQMKYYANGTKVDVTIQRLDNGKDGKYKEQKVSVTLGNKH
jgi:serine protease Do